MQDLKKYFITINREYKEGDVAVFRQKFSGDNIVSAVLYATALGVYEAELNGKKEEQRENNKTCHNCDMCLADDTDTTAWLSI